MNIEDFKRSWQNHQPDLQETQMFWDLRAEEFNSQLEHKGKKVAKLLELFNSREILQSDSQVLDIGCGPGIYTFNMAKYAKFVQGIDISPKMINFAEENAKKENIANVAFATMPWEEVDIQKLGWNNKYDLVFASMCPGIYNSDTLLKMCDVSKGYCFISSFATRQDELRDELHRSIYKQEPEKRWNKNIYYILNILMLTGYYPEITYIDTNWESVRTVEKSIEIYSHQLKQHTKQSLKSEDLTKQIRAYLEKQAFDDLVTEKIQAKIAWIHWKV